MSWEGIAAICEVDKSVTTSSSTILQAALCTWIYFCLTALMTCHMQIYATQVKKYIDIDLTTLYDFAFILYM